MAERRSWSARHDPGLRDTIFAVSTPPGRSAVAVIRLSGPHAGSALQRLIGKTLAPRSARFATFRDPGTGEALDEGLALWFPAPGSFTGEDAAELQIHGSAATVDATCRVLAGMADLREARAGEFTQRAFENGKLDADQVEALADLIDARTDGQRRLALRAFHDGPARLAQAWRDKVLDFLAEIDARLDFSDEGDVDALQEADLASRVREFAAEVSCIVDRARRARPLREGFVVAICGPPNSGKSTLMNALLGREHAIVSPYAGTTRDTIEVSLDLRGQLVTLIDTAGIREASDAVETIGIARAVQAAARADFTIWLEAPDARAEPNVRVDFRVMAKADLGGGADRQGISAKTGEGLDGLLATIAAQAAAGQDESGDASTLRERHMAQALVLATGLAEVADRMREGSPELAAAALRATLVPIAAMGSKALDEDVLDRIFMRFCIGK